MEKRVRKILSCLLLIIITTIVYLPVLGHDFLYLWDDHWVVMNHYTTGGINAANIEAIFTEFYQGQYAPLNEINYLILYSLFGYSSSVFHAVNLGWHLANVLLVFFFILSLLKCSQSIAVRHPMAISFLTALLWAIHPVHVEPVSWLSASKVLIYSFFYLSGLIVYIRYIRNTNIWLYSLLLLLFICSFLGKEQAVAFPLALLAVDFFLGRSLRDLRVWEEKIPFFALSFVMGLTTIISQGSKPHDIVYSIPERIIYGAFSFFEYLVKCVIPIKLSYIYPFPARPGGEVPLMFWVYPAVFVLISYCLWLMRRNKMVVFVFAFFLIHIGVVLHLISISRFAITADRYVYLSCVAVCFAIAYVFVNFGWEMFKWRRMVWCSCLFIYLLYFAIYSNSYTRRWKNSDTVKSELRELLNNRQDMKEMQELRRLMLEQHY